MRLCRFENGGFSLVEFFGKNTPLYAILSHTWGADYEEVTYKDLVDGSGTSKAGYGKIHFCAQQAAKDGLQYFWVDTCCIDKSNHTELHEAINSMFRWYQNAARCYVYLLDVSACDHEKEGQRVELAWEPAFRASRWFTRGWTLQELLAPVSVEFFTKDGQRLGDKSSLEQQIHEITGIAVPALQGSVALPKFDVEERFKWADTRKTTREEDWAYCLLGIFGIFMPLLYGEGKANAVRRLKKEIADAMNRDDMCSDQEGISTASSLQPPTSMFILSDTAGVSPLVASIIEVSAFGLRLSKCLRDYGSAVVAVEKRLKGLDKDVSFTSGILSELGTLLNDARVQTLVSEQSIRLARDAVAECDGIFQAMEGVIANIRKNGFGKFKIYFRETKIELLRSNLGRMKGNLTLLMGVINHTTQILLERPNETTLAVHRQKIRELMIEKEAYTQRYLAEKHKYDTLLAQINSTSTLGSMSTTLSDSLVPESSTNCIQAEEHIFSSQIRDVTDEITPCLLVPGHHIVDCNSSAPHHDGPLDSSHSAASRQEVRARSISAAPATTALPQKQLSKSNESIIENIQPKPSNRDKALKVVKKVTRGTGYFALGTVAVVFFPITIVVLVRRKRRRLAGMPAMVSTVPQNHTYESATFSTVPQYRVCESNMSSTVSQYQTYQSAMLPAELPGVHELESSGPAELEIVGALTNASLLSEDRSRPAYLSYEAFVGELP